MQTKTVSQQNKGEHIQLQEVFTKSIECQIASRIVRIVMQLACNRTIVFTFHNLLQYFDRTQMYRIGSLES